MFLNVLGKRRDGYHELETLFERISLGDTLRLKRARSGIRLRCTDKNLPTGPKNLVVRAAKLLQETYDVAQGVDLFLEKKIPIAAGLGGGSSDAAAALKGLNRLWGLQLSQKKLMALAARLGSDIPFFILNESRALGRGRGERLTVVKSGLTLWYCLVKPPFGISTREAYQAYSGLSLTPPKTDARMLVRSLKKENPKLVSDHLSNSLEHALNKRVMEIQALKARLLSAGALAALMTGSGSTVFGLFGSRKEAQSAAARLKRLGRRYRVFIASTF